MKSITFSADESLIAAARERALSENTTLNHQFRLWLTAYACTHRMQRYDELMSRLRGKVVLGRKLTRDQMNDG